MSEWSKFGEVPTQAGRYVLEDKRGHWWLADWRNGPIPREGYFAGNRHVLISEPPREPPKIRRFVGLHGNSNSRISGIHIEGARFAYWWRWLRDGGESTEHLSNSSTIELENIKELQWLDKEQP